MKSIQNFCKFLSQNKIILFTTTILTLINTASLLYIIIFHTNIHISIKTIFTTITIILYLVVMYNYITNSQNIFKLNESLENYTQHNKTLSLMYDNTKAFKHDFNNIIQAIGGYIASNDLPGLKTYYKQLMNDCKITNSLSTLSPNVINNPAIYNLLASKFHKANDLGVEINLEVYLNLNALNMKIYEFTRILGILLDNAIEACVQCTDKLINIVIREDFLANRQLLIVENTYNDINIDLDKIFEKGFTSKKNNTGLGLWEIRRIMSKSKNLNLFTSKTSRLFVQQLEIYKEVITN